ncbi:Fic family protein [Candidatus Bealeia paramacronuclearis]|uniref:Fic family protein n=1 Tax=Candidatus Bealeia paramacronuclearis TaxID=1921001 RepID=UPI002F26BA63
MQEKLYRIEQPNVPKDWEREAQNLTDDQTEGLIGLSENPIYLYWDKIKYKVFKDLSVSKEVAWAIILNHRKKNSRNTPVQSEGGDFFRFVPLQRWENTLLLFDKIFLNRPRGANVQSEPWMIEAISSAMIEGAHTTRDRALQLLHLHKTPADYGERMILNNYKMAQMLESLPLDFYVNLETLFEWQIQLTRLNLPQKDQGRLRTDTDHIVIAPKSPDVVTFIPPSEGFLKDQLALFIDFVNRDHPNLHPLLHAICIHYWFAYLHPFVDGNGRTARALFYWFLMKSGYPNITSLPLSPLILRSVQNYSKAFILTEQDHQDLTYFIDFNIRLIDEALVQFKANELIDSSQNDLVDERLNLRQNTIIRILKTKQLPDVNVSFVQQKFGVSKLTAIHDLKGLLILEIVESRRVGKNVLYRLKSRASL